MISSGMSALARCTCSAWGRILSSAKRWNVSRTSSKSASRWRGPWSAARRGQHRGVAVARRGRPPPARPSRARRPRAHSRPATRPARSATTSATNAHGRCGASSRPGRRSRAWPGRRRTAGGGVGQVVGHDLVGVDAAAAAHRRRRPGRPRDWASADRVGGAGEVRGGGRRTGATLRLARAVASRTPRERRSGARPTTVTSGGRTTGSSPGSTPVSDSQVGGDGPGPDAGGRLGPGVDDLEPGVADERGRSAPTSGWRASGMDSGAPPMRPAEVIGSCATTQPPGRTAAAMRPSTTAGSTTCRSRKRQKARSTGSGRSEVLAGLGDGEHLAVRRRGPRHLVAGARVAVDGVDPPVVADHLGQGHRDVAPAGAHVDAAPARAEAQTLEGGGERPPVDVVAQTVTRSRHEPIDAAESSRHVARAG